MPRKLKTYLTSQGFYDLAIAAPSMKAALEAWGASSNLFHQGFAKEAGDDDVIAATMEKPGVILRRPVGSSAPFSEHSDLPTLEAFEGPSGRQKGLRRKKGAQTGQTRREKNPLIGRAMSSPASPPEQRWNACSGA